MSKEVFTCHISATVKDSEDLPDGMTQDGAWSLFMAAMQKAASDWYAANPGLLSDEPHVV